MSRDRNYDKDAKKKYDIQYVRDKQSRIAVNWLKEDYEGRVKPAIQKSGMPVSTFIKAAVNEKILRDELDDSKNEIIPELKEKLLDMDTTQQQKVLEITKVMDS